MFCPQKFLSTHLNCVDFTHKKLLKSRKMGLQATLNDTMRKLKLHQKSRAYCSARFICNSINHRVLLNSAFLLLLLHRRYTYPGRCDKQKLLPIAHNCDNSYHQNK